MLDAPEAAVTPAANLPASVGLDTRLPAVAVPSRFRWPRLSTMGWFALSLLTIPIAIGLGALNAPRPLLGAVSLLGALLLGLSTLIALFRALHGAVALVRPASAPADAGIGGRIADIFGNLFMAAFGMLVAFFATFGFSRGRQLRRLGQVLLPGLRPSPAWTTFPVVWAGHEGVPAAVADQWRENGKTEHASVAAFAKLTLDLVALGAPPNLLAAANQDALDEIRHTELCFSLARAFDGKAVSPGPFPEVQRVAALPRSRTLALAKLAVDSLVDGALHEGVSARIIAKLAQRAEIPAVRAALQEIAADEGRHAAHGWAVVEWCLDEGGSPVGHALLSALRTLPQEMDSKLPEPAANGGWERWGIHGHQLECDEYGAALAHLAARVRRRMARPARQAA